VEAILTLVLLRCAIQSLSGLAVGRVLRGPECGAGAGADVRAPSTRECEKAVVTILEPGRGGPVEVGTHRETIASQHRQLMLKARVREERNARGLVIPDNETIGAVGQYLRGAFLFAANVPVSAAGPGPGESATTIGLGHLPWCLALG